MLQLYFGQAFNIVKFSMNIQNANKMKLHSMRNECLPFMYISRPRSTSIRSGTHPPAPISTSRLPAPDAGNPGKWAGTDMAV